MKKCGGFFLLLLLVLSPAAATAGSPSIVLFDQAHGELFSPSKSGPMDHSRFASLFEKQGFALKAQTKPFTAEALTNVAGVIISGSFSGFSDKELDVLERYVRAGGRLMVMLHVGPLVTPLCDRFGIVISTAVIHERDRALIIDGNEENFYLAHLAKHRLFTGVKKVGVFGAWGLLTEGKGTRVLGSTSDSAYADLNKNKINDPADPVQSFGIVAVAAADKGSVLVCGDDALFSNQLIGVGDNVKFAANMVRWLSGKDDTQGGAVKKL